MIKKLKTAYHEAGHAICTLVEDNVRNFVSITKNRVNSIDLTWTNKKVRKKFNNISLSGKLSEYFFASEAEKKNILDCRGSHVDILNILTRENKKIPIKNSKLKIKWKHIEKITSKSKKLIKMMKNHAVEIKLIVRNYMANNEFVTKEQVDYILKHHELMPEIQAKWNELSSEEKNFIIEYEKTNIDNQSVNLKQLFEAELDYIRKFSDFETSENKLNSELMCAILNNEIISIKRIVNYKNFNVNLCNLNHQTPLHLAVNTNQLDIAEYLLTLSKINVNIQDSKGYTSLHWAVITNESEMVKILVNSEKVSVNMQDYKGYTSLHWAIYLKNLDIVELLLKNPNIDVNLQNCDKDTALQLAIDSQQLDMVKIFQKDKIHHSYVEYFVSYFDFYQPEAYLRKSDTLIDNNSTDSIQYTAFDERKNSLGASTIYDDGENFSFSLNPYSENKKQNLGNEELNNSKYFPQTLDWNASYLEVRNSNNDKKSSVTWTNLSEKSFNSRNQSNSLECDYNESDLKHYNLQDLGYKHEQNTKNTHELSW